ncbi:fumarylacetoacetate hydrolase family protein [bacterium]|nr:fumarylacetoacetate hydrolase family protein [bacterium]
MIAMKVKVKEKNYEPQRIFCIGRNYVEHIRELDHDVPQQPVIFMKPPTCLVAPGQKICRPRHGNELHYESEIVVLLGAHGRPDSEDEAGSFIAGLTIGLDLTLRDVQNELKKKGLPWERAKAFDFSAPVGLFRPFDHTIDLENISFSCTVNDLVRQRGNSNLMIFSIKRLIVELGTVWDLLPGDLVYTGTPAGVGPLASGDRVTIQSEQLGSYSWEII